MGAKSRFFWHDLMVPDTEKAKAFYGELFGWSFKGEKGPEPYTHIMVGEEGIGGMMKLDPKHGAPPHWMGYVSVDDFDATMSQATKHGGKVLMPKTDVPEVGPFAVLADPHGAAFSPMHYIGKDANKPESARPSPHTFCWDELMTPDPAAAAKYYSAVFGWAVEAMEVPGFGSYTLLKRTGVKDEMGADRNAAGIMKMPPGMPMPFWLSYVAVPNADATAERAVKLGATMLAPPMDIPNVGRFAVFMDSQMAAFAILAPLPPAAAAK